MASGFIYSLPFPPSTDLDGLAKRFYFVLSPLGPYASCFLTLCAVLHAPCNFLYAAGIMPVEPHEPSHGNVITIHVGRHPGRGWDIYSLSRGGEERSLEAAECHPGEAHLTCQKERPKSTGPPLKKRKNSPIGR